MFDPAHSPLELDAAALRSYLALLGSTLGERVEVVAALEIGSFAKAEAVPSSDIDTRAYVYSPDAYVVNLFGSSAPPSFEAFLGQAAPLPCLALQWDVWNGPLQERLGAAIDRPVSVDIVDLRHAAFLFEDCARWSGDDVSLLLQSNVLWDPRGELARHRAALDGRRVPELAAYYRERALNRLHNRLPAFLAPEPYDSIKLEESGQIQWVAHAVRCLRDAVAAACYAGTGSFCYRKDDVLAFIRAHHPAHVALVDELYAWKTDPQLRARMVEQFRADPAPLYAQFAAAMLPLHDVVNTVLA